jgi:hypothetical protein
MPQFDLIDGHGYCQHPEIGRVTKINNDPMVSNPLDSSFTQFAWTPVAGKPFTVSEVSVDFAWLDGNAFTVSFIDPCTGQTVRTETQKEKKVRRIPSPPGEDLVLVVRTHPGGSQ